MKMYDNILNRVRAMEEKNGVKYAKSDGKLYKTLKVFYVLAVIYTICMNFLYASGILLLYAGKDDFKYQKPYFYTVVACTLLLLISLVVMRFKKYLWVNIATGVANLAAAVFLIPTFARLMEDTLGLWGYQYSFYWRHFVPLLLVIILNIWLTAVAVRAILKTNAAYKKVVNNIYMANNISLEDNNISEEQWEELLKSYEPNKYKKQF